jgi:ABC-type transporter Mla subunit MlaD
MPSDELQALLDSVEGLLRQLDELQETYGGALAELAAVDWQALGREGHLVGTPRLAIERTIEDARNVLSSGREALALMLQQAADPEMVANPDLDIPGRLRAVIRLYADTPNDLRNRCQRLTTWLTAIAQAQQQAGAPPLTDRITWPHTTTES